jgi:glyoxylase-like metal-dependent hydrolase (beta-lactamase superfamily II)
MRTLTKVTAGLVAVAAFLIAVAAEPDGQLPAMKFNDVREVAPGVFFRYSSISATDPKIPFGGCNNTWIVFKDYVVVIDANFPKEAGDVIEAVRKTTDKPIRYVLDTHHHGDHAYGNAVWAKAGAKIVASAPTARLLKVSGPKQWEEAARDRKDLKESELKLADVTFDEKHVLDDGTQRVEFLHLGHAHTAGDAVAYLPGPKILCTGDACVNGAFNFMGHSNSASWIKCLDKMQAFDVKIVCPGHGALVGKDVIGRQKRYFEELRQQVKQGIDGGKKLPEVATAIDMPWYKEWTGKEARENKDNVAHVFKELTGQIDHERIGRLDGAPWPYGEATGQPAVGGALGR